jgi:hypothetical protein
MTNDLTTRAPAKPAIEHAQVHTGLLRVVNPIFTAVLRSPLHRILGGFQPPLLLLTVTGRRSGRRYTIVVGRHDIDGVATIFTAMPWRVNLRGGADVQVTSDGVTSGAHAVLVEDPDQVADAYAAVIQRIGWKTAQRQLALKVNVGRTPTHAELAEAVAREHLSLVQIEAV